MIKAIHLAKLPHEQHTHAYSQMYSLDKSINLRHAHMQATTHIPTHMFKRIASDKSILCVCVFVSCIFATKFVLFFCGCVCWLEPARSENQSHISACELYSHVNCVCDMRSAASGIVVRAHCAPTLSLSLASIYHSLCVL